MSSRQRTPRGQGRRGNQASSSSSKNSSPPERRRASHDIPWSPLDPPKSRQDHVRTYNGKKYFWCTFHMYRGKRGCWTTHRAKDCPNRPERPDHDADQQRFEYELSSSSDYDDDHSQSDETSSSSIGSAALRPPPGEKEPWRVKVGNRLVYFCPFHGRWEKSHPRCDLGTREPSPEEPILRTLYGRRIIWCPIHAAWTRCLKYCNKPHADGEPLVIRYRNIEYCWDARQNRWRTDLSEHAYESSHGDSEMSEDEDDDSKSLDSAALRPPPRKGEPWTVNVGNRWLYFCPFHSRWEKPHPRCDLGTREPSPGEPMVRTLYDRKITWCPIHAAWTHCMKFCRKPRSDGDPLVRKYRSLEYRWDASKDLWTVTLVKDAPLSDREVFGNEDDNSKNLDSAVLLPPPGENELWTRRDGDVRLYFCPLHGQWEKRLGACDLSTREPSPTEPMVRNLYGRTIIWCPIHSAWTRCTRVCRKPRSNGDPLWRKYRGSEYRWDSSQNFWTVLLNDADESTHCVVASSDGNGKSLALNKPLNSKRRRSSTDMSAEGSPPDQAYSNGQEDHIATREETKAETPPTKRQRTTNEASSPHEEKILHETGFEAKPETMFHEKTATDDGPETAVEEPTELEAEDDLELIQTTRTVPISENAVESVLTSEAFENDVMSPFLSRVDFSQSEHSFGFSVRFLGVEKDPSTALLEMKGLPDTVASFIPCVSSKKTKNLVVCREDVTESSCRIGVVIDLRESLGFRLFSIPFASNGVRSVRLFLSVLDETCQPVRALRRYCKTSGACVLRLAGKKCQSLKEFREIMEENQGKHVLLEVLINDESDEEGIAMFKEAQQRNKKSSLEKGEKVAGAMVGAVAVAGPNKDAKSDRASALVDDASPSRPVFEDLIATSTNANPIPDEDTDEEMNETSIADIHEKTVEEEPASALTVYSEEDLSNSIRYKTFYETLKLLQGGAAAKITSDAPFQAMRETIKELRRTLPSRDSDSKRMKRDLDMKDKLLKLYLSCEWSIRKAFILHQTASFEIVVDQISLNFPITSYETWSNFRLCTQVFVHSNGHEERLPGLPPKSFSHTVIYDVHNDYELKTNPKSQDQALILCLSKELHDGSSPTEIGRVCLSASLLLEHCSRDGGWASLPLTVVAPDASAPSSFSGTIGIRARQKGEVERNPDTIHKETRRVRHVLEWISRFNSDMTAEEQESMFLSANILVGNVTLLHGAVLLEDAALVQDLIQAGANPLTRGASNTTAVDLAASLVDDADEEPYKVRRREVLQVLQAAVYAARES